MRDDKKWKQVTVRQARALQHTGALIWWRPNMFAASRYPDDDPAWILES